MINEIIEEQKKDFEDKFIINKVEDGEDYTLFLRDKDIWNWHIQSIKQILEEVEKMIEGEKISYENENDYYFNYIRVSIINETIDTILSKLKEIK